MSFYSIDKFIAEYYPEYWGYQSYPIDESIAIRKVDEPWGIFSNFAPTPLVIGGVSFRNSEELFQLMKFKDAEILDRIRNNITREGKTCYNIKKTVKSYEKDYRRDDWGRMVIDAMKYALLVKYRQCGEFRRALAASQGKHIVEDQATMPKKNPDAWGVKPDGDCFVGPNILGRLLMELRDNGTLCYTLSDDALSFIDIIRARTSMV